MRILIVDDDRNIRRTTAIVMEYLGHEAVGAPTGDQALEEMDRRTFDAVFLDVRLDGESGIDLLPKLLNGHPQLKIVVLTAYPSAANAEEARRGGAVEYIPKPFTPETIRQVLQRLA